MTTLPADVERFVFSCRGDDACRGVILSFLREVLAWPEVRYELNDHLQGVQVFRGNGAAFANVFPKAGKLQFRVGKGPMDHMEPGSGEDLVVALGHATEAYDAYA